MYLEADQSAWPNESSSNMFFGHFQALNEFATGYVLIVIDVEKLK